LKSDKEEKEYWMMKEARGLIKERFGVKFSEGQIVKMFRYKLKYTCL